MTENSRRIIGVVAILLVLCCLCLFFSFVSYPSTATIAQNYLDAVSNENLEAAISLARSDTYCQPHVQENALQDIHQFGGAEVRAVKIEVKYNDGSDDELQFALVDFEYRKPNQSDWQHGEMRLVTDHEIPGFRYLCGNAARK